MDKDITDMFHEKNKDIFKNSLLLEMERNIDTLKHATNNAVILEMNKINKFLKEYLEEIGITYSEKKLKNKIDKEKETIKNLIDKEIENKKKQLEAYFNKKLEKEVLIDANYIDKYHKHIDGVTAKTIEDLEISIRKEINTIFTPGLLKNYAFKKEEQTDRIIRRINNIMVETTIKRIVNELKFRDDSLKNMCNESFNKYLNLNEMTS